MKERLTVWSALLWGKPCIQHGSPEQDSMPWQWAGIRECLTRGIYNTMLSPQGHGGFGVAERRKGVSRRSSRMGRIPGSRQEGQVCASVWLLWGTGKDEANQSRQGWAWSGQICRFYPWSGRAVVTSRMYKTLVVAGWPRDLFRSRERKNWGLEAPNSPEVMPHNTLY